MGHVYRIWFKWGFFTASIAAGFSLFVRCFEGSESSFGPFKAVLFGCFGVSLCLNFVTFITLGLMWRFSDSGRVVSGDRLIKTKEMLTDEQLWRETLEEASYQNGYQI